MATRTSDIAAVVTNLGDPAVSWSAKLNGVSALLTSLNNPSTLDKPVVLPTSTPSGDGAADMTKNLFLLGSGFDLTGFTPAYVGQPVVIWCTASGTDPSVTCGAGVTINATGNNKMTFPDADDAMVMVAASLTRWNIILNIGTVTLATV